MDATYGLHNIISHCWKLKRRNSDASIIFQMIISVPHISSTFTPNTLIKYFSKPIIFPGMPKSFRINHLIPFVVKFMLSNCCFHFEVPFYYWSCWDSASGRNDLVAKICKPNKKWWALLRRNSEVPLHTFPSLWSLVKPSSAISLWSQTQITK